MLYLDERMLRRTIADIDSGKIQDYETFRLNTLADPTFLVPDQLAPRVELTLGESRPRKAES